MPSGDRAERVCPGDHGEPERQGHAMQSDADVRERGGEHRAAAPSENEPERAEQLGRELRNHGRFLCWLSSD